MQQHFILASQLLLYLLYRLHLEKHLRAKRALYVFFHIQTYRSRTVDVAVIMGNDWSAEKHTRVFSNIIRQLISRGQSCCKYMNTRSPFGCNEEHALRYCTCCLLKKNSTNSFKFPFRCSGLETSAMQSPNSSTHHKKINFILQLNQMTCNVLRYQKTIVYISND